LGGEREGGGQARGGRRNGGRENSCKKAIALVRGKKAREKKRDKILWVGAVKTSGLKGKGVRFKNGEGGLSMAPNVHKRPGETKLNKQPVCERGKPAIRKGGRQ